MSPLKATPSLLANFYSFLAFTFSLSSIVFLQQPLFANSALMKCVECSLAKCGTPPENCPLGLVWDSCDCCKICGRMEGEFCGGQFNHYGRCGQGLKCHMTRAYSVFGMCVVDTTSPASAFSYSANNKSAPASYDTKLQKPLNSERKKDDGTKKRDLMKLQELPGSMVVLPSYKINEDQHKALKTTMPPPQMDDPRVGFNNDCHPECTVEFCEGNPRALCSAYRQKDINNCKDPCATTVCRACGFRFDASLTCTYCPYGQKFPEEKKHTDCIKEFGRCVKKGLSRKKADESPVKLRESSFYCEVSTC